MRGRLRPKHLHHPLVVGCKKYISPTSPLTKSSRIFLTWHIRKYLVNMKPLYILNLRPAKQIILIWVPVLTHRSELYSHTVGMTVCIIQYQYTHHHSYWQTITYSDVLLRICLLDLLTYDWLTGGVANINTISHTRASSHAPFVCCCEVWNQIQAVNSHPEFVDSFTVLLIKHNEWQFSYLCFS